MRKLLSSLMFIALCLFCMYALVSAAGPPPEKAGITTYTVIHKAPVDNPLADMGRCTPAFNVEAITFNNKNDLLYTKNYSKAPVPEGKQLKYPLAGLMNEGIIRHYITCNGKYSRTIKYLIPYSMTR